MSFVSRYNPIQIPRVDVATFDAIFTEMSVSDAGARMLVASMSPLKPATMWTTRVPSDAEFASALLHGIFPMAPAPSGDHSLGLDGLDQFLKWVSRVPVASRPSPIFRLFPAASRTCHRSALAFVI